MMDELRAAVENALTRLPEFPVSKHEVWLACDRAAEEAGLDELGTYPVYCMVHAQAQQNSMKWAKGDANPLGLQC